MVDDDLAKAMGLTEQEAAVIIPRLSTEARAMYEHLAQVADELVLWEAGVGPMPKGIIVCKPRCSHG